MKTLPTLYKRTSTGAIQMWSIGVEKNVIIVNFGQVDGKIQRTEETIKDGKNITPQMAATRNDSSQVWTLVPWGEGTYKLTNDFSGPKKSLGAYGDPPRPYLSTSDDPRQFWKITQEKPISA